MRSSIEAWASRIPSSGLLLLAVLLASAALAGSSASEEPSLNGMLDRTRYEVLRNDSVNYVCTDENRFTLHVSGAEREFAVFVDGANGLAFNLQGQPVSTGRRYGDGVLDVAINGTDAQVRVSGTVRYTDCELRTRYYDCPAGTYFGFETLGVSEEQAIIQDGTNRKMFTLDRMDSAGLMYGDGVILVDRTGPAANVYVDGQVRFGNCTLRPV